MRWDSARSQGPPPACLQILAAEVEAKAEELEAAEAERELALQEGLADLQAKVGREDGKLAL